MMSKKKLSLGETKKVLSLPTCQVDEKNTSMAHVDKCSARIKKGGIHVTIYPIINGKIKGPREVRQKIIMDSVVRQDIVNFAQKTKRGRKKKAKKKPLSTEKHLQKHVLSTNA
ncbi:MAG TPA: hypothetical protein VJ926_03130 [Patescibacteria group bacterium]|nr:hypothetical protein [Patescibacteria group bacterium]